MRVRSACLVGTVAALLLGACETSPVDPDATVTVGGSITGGDGDEIASQTVVLLTEPTVSDVAFGLPFGLGSLGFACLADDPPPPCDTRRRAETDSAGNFTFTLTGRETQGTFGEAARMTLSAAAAAEEGEHVGPATTGAFVVRSEQVALEPVALVRARPSLDTAGTRALVTWAWQSGAPMRGTPGAAEIVFQVGEHPVWVASAGNEPDLRALEDTRGAVGVVEHRRAEGIIDDLTYRSELVAYRSGAGAPVSRGATCRVLTHDGVGLPQAPCPWTDGRWNPAPVPDAGTVDVDLGQPRAVELVVVRGCDDACPVSMSRDGSVWEPLADVATPFAVVARPDATPVQFVRVGVDTAGSSLVEISAWDGPAAGLVLERDTEAVRQGPAPGTAGAVGDGPSVLPWVLVGLGLLGALGAGIAVGRRSGAGT